MLSVTQGKRGIVLSTHRHTISLAAYDNDGKEQKAFHEFTFDQLHSLIRNLAPGIENDVP